MNIEETATLLRTFSPVQRLSPAPSAKSLCQHSKRQRQQHPCPVHLMLYHIYNMVKVLATIHPIEDASTENQRHQNIYDVTNYLHIRWQSYKKTREEQRKSHFLFLPSACNFGEARVTKKREKNKKKACFY